MNHLSEKEKKSGEFFCSSCGQYKAVEKMIVRKTGRKTCIACDDLAAARKKFNDAKDR